MTPENATKAHNAGLPITCGTCKHVWNGDEVRETCGQVCGGPTKGLAFPAYDGPIPRYNFRSCCLVCWKPRPTHIMSVRDDRFGLCDEHYHVFEHVKEEEGLTHPVAVLQLPHAKPKTPKFRVEFKP